MSENIIYCYSGAVHCLDMAKKIARGLGDTDIVMMRSFPAKTDAREARRVGFIFSCMAGGLPGDVESYVRAIQIAPGTYTFAVEQYAGYLGCGLRKIDEIVPLNYWAGVSNHSTAIWLMPHTLTLAPKSLDKAEERVEKKTAKIVKDILSGKRRERRPSKAKPFELMSKGLGQSHARRVAKFAADESCTGCGLCASLCPRGNIRIEGGKPVFGSNCMGCLSCVQLCPEAALNIGNITKKRARIPDRNVSASELMEKIIHID